jgi:hypothetical protein
MRARHKIHSQNAGSTRAGKYFDRPLAFGLFSAGFVLFDIISSDKRDIVWDLVCVITNEYRVTMFMSLVAVNLPKI